MRELSILRLRKNVPGVGRKIARYFNAQEVVCGYPPSDTLAPNGVILNYGRSDWPIWLESALDKGIQILNKPHAVHNSVDKRLCFGKLHAASVPMLEATTSFSTAVSWAEEGLSVIVRNKVKSKKGRGIELYKTGVGATREYIAHTLPRAPLYTKYYDKTHEFRVHVFNGKVIDLVQKKKMGKKKRESRGIIVDPLVRNHQKGWVFAHNDLICDGVYVLPEEDNGRKFIEELGIAATKAVGLDYCGVDVLAKYDENGFFKDAVVCETNSAPGMSSPTTFDAYCKAIRELLEN